MPATDGGGTTKELIKIINVKLIIFIKNILILGNGGYELNCYTSFGGGNNLIL
jgi:hypothetical protein